MADHLLPPGTLVSAQPPLLAHLQPGQFQPWLQEHRGKTCIVQGATWMNEREPQKGQTWDVQVQLNVSTTVTTVFFFGEKMVTENSW